MDSKGSELEYFSNCIVILFIIKGYMWKVQTILTPMFTCGLTLTQNLINVRQVSMWD